MVVQRHEDVPSGNTGVAFDLGVAGRVIMSLIFITVLWTFAVANTELLLVENKFQPTEPPAWTFGQVRHAHCSCRPSYSLLQTISMILVVGPAISVLQVFQKYGWGSKLDDMKTNKKTQDLTQSVPPPTLNQP